MKVKDVMTMPVATCRPGTNLAEAGALMWENDCGVLPVVDAAGELAGVVTDRDMFIALGTRNVAPSALTVAELLCGQTLTCRSSDSIQRALMIMREGKVRRLPVVDEAGAPEGIVSMDDIVLNAEGGIGRVARQSLTGTW